MPWRLPNTTLVLRAGVVLGGRNPLGSLNGSERRKRLLHGIKMMLKTAAFSSKKWPKTAKILWKGFRKLKGEFRQKYRIFGENSKKMFSPILARLFENVDF